MALRETVPGDPLAGTPLPADLGAALEAAAPRLGPFAGRVRFSREATSTNDLALALAAAGAPEGSAIVADAQTAGRGRRGRSWFSPPGAGLYVSLVLRPEQAPAALASDAVAFVTLAAGVALADGVRSASGLQIELKWPNDLVMPAGGAMRRIRWRKLGGILAEAAGLGSGEGSIVLGFGLNVRAAVWPRELAERATSIEIELGRPVDRAVVLVEVLAAVAACYDELRAGGREAILDRWRSLSPASRGVSVRWVDAGVERRGVTAGIDASGALLVADGDGMIRLVSSELVWEGEGSADAARD